MYSLPLINSIKELTAGDVECMGSDDFLEVPLSAPPFGPTEQGHMTSTEV